MALLASAGGRVSPAQQLAAVLKKVLLGTSTYTDIKLNGLKTYRALITQSGTSAPTAEVLENTLGGTVVLARSAGGTYTLTLASAFTADKTFATIGNTKSNVGSAAEGAEIRRTSANVMTIKTADVVGTSLADTLLSATPVEILVYP